MKRVNNVAMKPGLSTRGFTLIELLMALGIAGMIAAFAISISSSISGLSKMAMTKARMETIAAKARQYYRSHKVQVTAATTPADSVPVTSTGLNLEQKYRLDGWGKFLYYRVFDSSDLTNISGFDLNSSSVKVGAVIISAGSDQLFGPKNDKIDKIKSDDEFNDRYNDSGKYWVAVDNDLILWVSFNQEATEITLEELQVLQEKVEAFDAMFEGIDNDGDDGVDEDGGCIVDTDNTTGCPPCGVNDPNCGRATLDDMEDTSTSNYSACSFDTTSAVKYLVDFYGLSSQYLIDPWGADYQWHVDNAPTSPPSVTERYHHKFWSYGPTAPTAPNVVSVDYSDDIIY